VVEIRAELAQPLPAAEMKALAERTAAELEENVGLRAKVIYVMPGAFAQPEGKKVVRITDNRGA
jgi:hypothetical protein